MALITLGLDLGIASIGWALLSEDNNERKILCWGSRIFEAGMEGDISSGKGASRCAEKRLHRALRIQYQRRKQRKEELISALINTGLFPAYPDNDFFKEIDQRLLKLFSAETKSQMAHLIPYLYRKMALDKPLRPEELGRAIYHLAQRRGYLSNRKQEAKDEDSGKVKSGIKYLQEEIEKSGARTLGEYFCSVNPEEERIRTRYTQREMYQEEFRKICVAQRHLISEENEKALFHAIFYQRPLKSCKHLIGKCRLYPELQRCSYSKNEAQLFRIHTTVRNLRIDSKGIIRQLSENEYKKAVEILDSYSPLFTVKGTITLEKLKKAIGLAKGEKFTLADGQKEIYGNQLKNILFHAFGEKAQLLSDAEKEMFFNDLGSIRKEEVFVKRLREYWKLSPEQAENAARLTLPDDYCSFSRKALKELLPDIEAGINLNTILKLTHPENNKKIYEKLPLLDDIGIDLRNPVVHRVLTELRRLINSIIDRYGNPDNIRIELARDLKATNEERKTITERNRNQEKSRAEIAAKITKEVGITNPSRNDILKVMLAEECNFECPYSGTSFNMKDLFNGMLEIEHIIPYSRSFDDSFGNKTLCLRDYNERKNNRTPYEAFGGSSEYDSMLARVSHFKGNFKDKKLEYFKIKEVDSNEFLAKNLNDTRYASKLAVQYLAILYGGIVDKTGKQRIFTNSGTCTALVRRAWGGNFLLGEGEKVRDDHRHHAIDALTIALTTPAMVKEIASMSPELRKQMQKSSTFYDNTLFQQAKNELENIAVSHHVVNKLRGELHNATFYSKDYGNNERHVRIKLEDMKAKELKNVVDESIKNLILEKLGISSADEATDKMFQIFKDAENLPVMKDKSGNIINTLKKIRVRKNQQTRTIGKGDGKREVANGANHILAIFAELDNAGNEIGWQGEIISLFDAVQRHQKGLPLFEKDRPGMKFKFSFQKGDIVKWTKDEEELLCIIRGVSLPQFQCVKIRDARMQKDIKATQEWYQPTVSAAFYGKMQKFNMNIFGELQRAND